MAELENEEEKAKCTANDETCKTCFEMGCNRKTNFMQCLVTNEDQSSAWSNFESISSPKMCSKYDDKCFVQVIKEDTVIRGCVEDYAAQNDLSSNFLTKIENKRTYQVCSGSLCNDKEVSPLYCLRCNSTADPKCVDNPREHMYFHKRCHPLEVENSGCYHYVDGDHVERGCITDLNITRRNDCESDSEKCKMCNGDECNSKKNFLKCLSSKNDDVTPESKLCRRYIDACFIHASDEKVTRGCVSDLVISPVYGIDILSDCRNPLICEKCLVENCNKRKIENEHCIVCSSKTDKINNICEYGPSIDMREQCPLSLKQHGCYLRDGHRNVSRGCVSKLSREEKHDCTSLNTNCKTCKGDSCNKKKFLQICKECSSETNADHCVSSPWCVTDRYCPNYMDKCYTFLKDGIVRRNCTGDDLVATDEDCSDPEHCTICDDFKCNKEPIKGEKCLVCDSDKDPACAMFNKLPKFEQMCPLSLHEEGCYHFIDEDLDRHIRGTILCVLKATLFDLKHRIIRIPYSFELKEVACK